jgi:hypothetical protein
VTNYYVSKNAQPNGDHEVHRDGCIALPHAVHRIHLGTFSDCRDAVDAGKGHYSQVNGCHYCCDTCHTR